MPTDKKQKKGVNTEDHARQMLHKEDSLGIKPGNVVRISDHHGLGGALITTASRTGFKSAPCRSNDRTSRRDAALAAFAKRPNRYPYWAELKHLPEGDYPNVFLFRDRCPNLISEMQFLHYRQSAATSSIDTSGDDDLIDPMEYLIEYWHIGMSFRQNRSGQALGRRLRYDSTGYYRYGHPA